MLFIYVKITVFYPKFTYCGWKLGFPIRGKSSGYPTNGFPNPSSLRIPVLPRVRLCNHPENSYHISAENVFLVFGADKIYGYAIPQDSSCSFLNSEDFSVKAGPSLLVSISSFLWPTTKVASKIVQYWARTHNDIKYGFLMPQFGRESIRLNIGVLCQVHMIKAYYTFNIYYSPTKLHFNL